MQAEQTQALQEECHGCQQNMKNWVTPICDGNTKKPRSQWLWQQKNFQ